LLDETKISMEEFKDYFGDHFLSTDDMNKLFSEIDLDHNGTIEIDELFSYFRKDPFNRYLPLFQSLETCHSAISSILLETSKIYDQCNYFDKFKIRIFLKEFIGQLSSLTQPISIALKKIEKQTESHIVPGTDIPIILKTSREYLSLPPALEKQINRLSNLISKLENNNIQINNDVKHDDKVNENDVKHDDTVNITEDIENVEDLRQRYEKLKIAYTELKQKNENLKEKLTKFEEKK